MQAEPQRKLNKLAKQKGTGWKMIHVASLLQDARRLRLHLCVVGAHAHICVLKTLSRRYSSMLQRVCRRHPVCNSLPVCCFRALILLSALFPAVLLPPPPLRALKISLQQTSQSSTQGQTARAWSTRCREDTHRRAAPLCGFVCVCERIHLGDAPFFYLTIWKACA